MKWYYDRYVIEKLHSFQELYKVTGDGFQRLFSSRRAAVRYVSFQLKRL